MRLHPAPSLPALHPWPCMHGRRRVSWQFEGQPHTTLRQPCLSVHHLHLHPLASSQSLHNLACAGCCCSIVPALYLHLHPLPSSHTPSPDSFFTNLRVTLTAQAAAAQLLPVPSKVRRPTPAGRDRRARLAGHGLPRAGAPRHPRACAEAAGGPVRARQVGAGGVRLA